MKPQLRFKEFTAEWQKNIIDDVAIKVGSGSTPKGGDKSYLDEGVIFIRSQNVNNNMLLLDDAVYISHETHQKMKNSQIQPNDILLNITGASIGRSCIVPSNFLQGNLNQHVCIIRLKEDNSYFLHAFLSSYKGQLEIQKKQTGSGREGINFQSIRAIKFYKPTLAEQTKIANFFTLIDKKINQLQQKYDLLKQYKKGVMQQIFSQKLRFKKDDGSDFADWEERVLKDFATRVTRKNTEDNQNPLTISAQLGLISQKDFFDRQIASKNLKNYYLLKKDEFAYNKSYSAGYPMGAIKKLKKYDKGVVSTLYICFSLNDTINKDFFQHFADAGCLIYELYKIAQEGARNHGLLNIALKDFFDIKMQLPTLEEQNKIANFLTAIDDKIDNTKDQLEQTQQWKKGLLQQMFV